MFLVFSCIGQNHCRTVNSKDAHAVVGDERSVVVSKLTYGVLKLDVDFMRYFSTGLRHGASADNTLRHVKLEDRLKELVKFILKRTLDKVRQEENHQWEGEDTVADEVPRRCSVLFLKLLGKNKFSDAKNQLNAELR